MEEPLRGFAMRILLAMDRSEYRCSPPGGVEMPVGMAGRRCVGAFEG